MFIEIGPYVRLTVLREMRGKKIWYRKDKNLKDRLVTTENSNGKEKNKK